MQKVKIVWNKILTTCKSLRYFWISKPSRFFPLPQRKDTASKKQCTSSTECHQGTKSFGGPKTGQSCPTPNGCCRQSLFARLFEDCETDCHGDLDDLLRRDCEKWNLMTLNFFKLTMLHSKYLWMSFMTSVFLPCCSLSSQPLMWYEDCEERGMILVNLTKCKQLLMTSAQSWLQKCCKGRWKMLWVYAYQQQIQWLIVCITTLCMFAVRL